jgi:hypothetical protein
MGDSDDDLEIINVVGVDRCISGKPLLYVLWGIWLLIVD